MHTLDKSTVLKNILYDIRGPIMQEAEKMQRQGTQILHLNIGNPMPFGFRVAPRLRRAVRDNLHRSEGYVNSNGIPEVREVLYEYYRARQFALSSIDDIYIGNGVSELIHLTMQALLNRGDEVLIPAPDYPLWTAAVKLSGGVAKYYRCDEDADWYPDTQDMRRQITPRTKIIVVINPNNPTGALYSREVLMDIVELAAEHKILLCSDEVYSRMIYDNFQFHHIAPLASEAPVFTYSGLSKNHLACGFRSGWMAIHNATRISGDFRVGLSMLSNMRLCSNVPTQWAIPAALHTENESKMSASVGKRLHQQRQAVLDTFAKSPLIQCVEPKAAFYLFPKIDAKKLHIKSDTQFALDLLRKTHILVVQGSGFNYPDNNHFRMTFLPPVDMIKAASEKIVEFIEHYTQQ